MGHQPYCGSGHALFLYISQKPLDVQAVSDTLSVARSNASTSLRELRGWGLVRSVHLLGDRREHFEAVGDVWHILSIVTEERKRREIDPTLAILRECAAELGSPSSVADRFISVRIKNMLEMFETLSPLIDEFVSLPSSAIKTMSRLLNRQSALPVSGQDLVSEKLFSFNGVLSRRDYIAIALIGVLVKHVLDVVVATQMFHHAWTPLNYLIPLGIPLDQASASDRAFLAVMLALSIPFAWVGMAITVKRFRAIGWPPWTVLFFFVPIANIVSFAVAAAWPEL